MRLIDADKIEYYNDEQGFEIAYKVNIDALPTLTQPNEWVSVYDRLPEPGDECLLQTADLLESFTSTSVGNGSDTTLTVLNCLWHWTFCIGCPFLRRLTAARRTG